MKIKQNSCYLKHVYEHTYNIKLFWMKRFKKRRKRRIFRFRRKARCQWKKIDISDYAPKCARYWKFPSVYKKRKYNAFWKKLFKNYKRFPWLTGLIQRRSLYKRNYIRQTYSYKYPNNRAKNKFYKKEFTQYTTPKNRINWWKNTLRKRRIQNRPIVRYFVYSPYLNHITVKKLIKRVKNLKKIKTHVVENMQMKPTEWKIKNFLTRINFTVNKKNAIFFKEINAVAKHNSKIINLTVQKHLAPVYVEYNYNRFDWKYDRYLNIQLPSIPINKNLLNKTESLSINKNYLKLNWTFFLLLQKKKYLPHYCNINFSKNIVYINRCFFYRSVLKNERLCRKYWTPITLLKNKIKYHYI